LRNDKDGPPSLRGTRNTPLVHTLGSCGIARHWRRRTLDFVHPKFFGLATLRSDVKSCLVNVFSTSSMHSRPLPVSLSDRLCSAKAVFNAALRFNAC